MESPECYSGAMRTDFSSAEVPEMELDVLPASLLKRKARCDCRIFLLSLVKAACLNPCNVECFQYMEYHESNLSP